MVLGSLVFGIVSYYYTVVVWDGDGDNALVDIPNGEGDIILVDNTNGRPLEGPERFKVIPVNETFFKIVPAQPPVVHPLKDYHFLSYVFFASGLTVLAYPMLTRGSKIRIAGYSFIQQRKWLIFLLAGLAIGFGIGYWLLPK